MDVKKTLEELIERDGLDNISLNENSFTVYFGDVLNTETETGNQYYLLGTYVEMPYSLIPSKVRLHREIINEYETGGELFDWNYSGFVHYEGGITGSFCWGQCKVDAILNEAILNEEFNEDTYYKLILHFDKYLSTSSHDSNGRDTTYKKLDLQNISEIKTYLTKTKTVDDMVLPFEITQIIKKTDAQGINYDLPYKEVIKEFTDRGFWYKGEKIIPKVVRHFTKVNTITEIKKQYINVNSICENIEYKKIRKIQDEINNKPRITLQDLLHKLSDSQRRVDGGIRI